MATNNALTLTPDVSNEGSFRLFGRAVAAQMLAMGFAKTTDTGQLNWDSAEARSISTNPTYPAVNAFDNNAGIYHQSLAAPTTGSPQAVLFDAGVGQTFTPASWGVYTTGIAADPKDVILQHSNDGTTWTDFDTRSLTLSTGYQQFNIVSAPAKRMWRMQCTSTQSTSTFMQVTELQLWTGSSFTGVRAIPVSLRPVNANTSAGYEFYKMTGALSVTAPIILRIEYGTGGAATYPSLWLTVGTATDGAGNFSGVTVSERRQLSCNGNALTPQRCAISGDVNRIAMALFYNSSTYMFFALERTRDAAGAETSEGAVIIGVSAVQRFQMYVSAVGAPPTTETDLGCIAPTVGTGARGNTIGLYGIKPFAPDEKPQMITSMAYFTTDLTQEVPILGVKLFGQAGDRTIFPIGNNITTIARGNASTRLALLWE